jgi:TubC N-terminal docking domain
VTPHVLLADLRRRGVTVQTDGVALRLRPRSALTEADLKALRAAKASLIELLRAEAADLPGLVIEAARLLGVAPGDVLIRPLPPGSGPVCFFCRGRRFWRSVYGRTVCADCHPPAGTHVIAGSITERP